MENGEWAYVDNIPAKGYACVKHPNTDNSMKITEHSLENDFYRIEFDENMLLCSIYDIDSNKSRKFIISSIKHQIKKR